MNNTPFIEQGILPGNKGSVLFFPFGDVFECFNSTNNPAPGVPYGRCSKKQPLSGYAHFREEIGSFVRSFNKP
jgi:hypothetical protein